MLTADKSMQERRNKAEEKAAAQAEKEARQVSRAAKAIATNLTKAKKQLAREAKKREIVIIGLAAAEKRKIVIIAFKLLRAASLQPGVGVGFWEGVKGWPQSSLT